MVLVVLDGFISKLWIIYANVKEFERKKNAQAFVARFVFKYELNNMFLMKQLNDDAQQI